MKSAKKAKLFREPHIKKVQKSAQMMVKIRHLNKDKPPETEK